MHRLFYIVHRTGFITVIKFDSIVYDESFKGKKAFKRVLHFCVNNNRTTALEQQPKPLGDLNTFYWQQISALDYAVVEVQEMFSSHESL